MSQSPAPAAPLPIIERLQKLMRMADDAGSPNEAALASERMQALLQEFNLTRADIEARGDEPEETAANAKRERAEHQRSAMYQYQRQLMQTIAENNFCMYLLRTSFRADPNGKRGRWDAEAGDYIRGRRVKSHVLIGRSENVQASILMYDYLLDTMFRLLPFQGLERLESPARLWLAGCADTLCERLTKQRTGREAEEPELGTPGLVRLADLYGTEEDLNRDFRRGVEPGTTARERRESEAEEAELKRKQKELVANGMDSVDAWYVARGMEADHEPRQYRKLSPSELRRREEAQERREHREYDRDRRERFKKHLKLSSPSYQDGRRCGHDIGLGGSIGGSETKSLT